jgi:hypothetical protein
MSPHEHAGHEHAGHAHDEHDHDELDACIEACLQCHVVCTMTAQYCLTQGGEHAEVGHVGLLLDCAEICQTSANFMIRGSPYHALTCGVCAEVCRECASACRAFGDDENMAHCAEVCEECADSCERMSSTQAASDDDDET